MIRIQADVPINIYIGEMLTNTHLVMKYINIEYGIRVHVVNIQKASVPIYI